MLTSMTRGLVTVLLPFICASAFAQNAPAVTAMMGSAVLVVGHARLLDAQRHATLVRGTSIVQGDTIETGADGYVYITTVDQGFVSVRPNSSFTVEHYAYDAAAPEKTEIKLTLHYGVVREISGKGAQAARDHYRMNTPVAALGVRGTDFSVFTDANVTRATVLSGGIIMTPLGQSCATTGVGPCEGASAALLFADQRNALLQTDRGSTHSVLIEAKVSQLMPDQAAQALKSEDSAARVATEATVQPGVAPAELSFPLTPDAKPDTPTQPAPPVTTPPVTPAPEAQQIFWGRYTSVADAASTLASLQAQGSEVVGQISSYDMTRTPQTNMVMPVTGKFSFQLQQGAGLSEAFLVDASGTRTQAAISGASLSVDFGAHTFATSLTVSANGASYNVTGQGGVSQQDGKLYSALTSPALIRGALAGSTADQAGYVFSESVNSKTTAVGATLWSRQ
jgi:hypothetical protein